MLRLPVLLAMACLGGPAAQAAQPGAGAVPFVGCPAEGMSGPAAAPRAPPHRPVLPGASASKLALYAAEGMAVLAPRGWHCIEVYGSGGAFLLVTPEPHTAEELQVFRPLKGPAVELVFLNGWTSGRFDVARVLARLFPSRRRFVRQVIAEGVESARAFPFGPYPTDQVVRWGRTEVEFVTPAGRTGMGTAEGRLAPDAEPVRGLATLAAEDGVTLLNVRLPPGLHALAPILLRATREARARQGP